MGRTHEAVVKFALGGALVLALASTARAAVFIDVPSKAVGVVNATARTDILNPSGAVVTTVVSGTVVHDKVFVDRLVGTPAGVANPTGSVIFHRFTSGDCTGTATCTAW